MTDKLTNPNGLVEYLDGISTRAGLRGRIAKSLLSFWRSDSQDTRSLDMANTLSDILSNLESGKLIEAEDDKSIIK
jgi:hypothetical protein